MKLFLFRLLWAVTALVMLTVAIICGLVDAVITFFYTVFDIFKTVPEFPEVEEVEYDAFYWETPDFFDRESSALEPESVPTPLGNDYVLVGDKKVAVKIVKVTSGYSVYSIDDPAMDGFGCSVTTAKYAFYCNYKRLLAATTRHAE
jgi:hypothetical protein